MLHELQKERLYPKPKNSKKHNIKYNKNTATTVYKNTESMYTLSSVLGYYRTIWKRRPAGTTRTSRK